MPLRSRRWLLSLLADVRCEQHRLGVRETARRRSAGALGWIRARQDDLVLFKDLAGTPAAPADDALVVEPLHDGNFEVLADFNERRCSSRETEKFIVWRSSGCNGFVLLLDDDVIGYYWWVDHAAGRRHRHVIRYRIDLKDDEAYGFDYFIDPDRRGHNRSTACLKLIEEELARLGYRCVWGYVEGDNAPARWLFAISGYDVAKRVRNQRPMSRMLFRARSALIERRWSSGGRLAARG